MKILVSLYGTADEPECFKMTESDWSPARKPWFVPDFDSEFIMVPVVVARLTRLGKSIAERFAHRYFDTLTTGFAVRAANLYESLKGQALPVDPAVSFDGSAIIGTKPLSQEGKLVVTKNGAEICSLDIEAARRDIEKAIVRFSQRSTLKNGDFVMVGYLKDGFPIAERDVVEAGGEKIRAL